MSIKSGEKPLPNVIQPKIQPKPKSVPSIIKQCKASPILLPDSPRARSEPVILHITPSVHHHIYSQPQPQQHFLVSIHKK